MSEKWSFEDVEVCYFGGPNCARNPDTPRHVLQNTVGNMRYDLLHPISDWSIQRTNMTHTVLRAVLHNPSLVDPGTPLECSMWLANMLTCSPDLWLNPSLRKYAPSVEQLCSVFWDMIINNTEQDGSAICEGVKSLGHHFFRWGRIFPSNVLKALEAWPELCFEHFGIVYEKPSYEMGIAT